MSWDSYRENLLASKKLCEAGLFGLNGAKWTASQGLANVSDQQILAIVDGFRDPNNLRQSGIKLGDKKYLFLTSTDDSMQGKKGQTGITVAKTNQCIIIGLYDEGMQAGGAACAVGNVGDYLKTQGY